MDDYFCEVEKLKDGYYVRLKRKSVEEFNGWVPSIDTKFTFSKWAANRAARKMLRNIRNNKGELTRKVWYIH